jgi:Fe-S-cluster-containing hydrogenase component 2
MVHPEEEKQPAIFKWIGKILGGRQTAAPEAEQDTGKALAVKCDLCRGIAGGPACVRSCPTGAVIRLKPDEYFERIQSMAFKG